MDGGDITATLRRMAELFGRHGKAEWRDRLAGLADRAGEEPLACATGILGLYAGRGTLDDAVPREGYAEPGPEREEAFEFARLRWALYQQAVALWHAHRRREPEAGGDGVVLDYGWGGEVRRRGGQWFVRHDVGSHASIWREDLISADEAAQAALGPGHLSRMVAALQNRLKAAGEDPWKGNLGPDD